MRKLVVLTFLSLDGVMQAPGAPEEDIEGDFRLGGWTVPFFDEALGEIMAKQISEPFDLLLGRKTFDLFASYWPLHREEGKGINNATKFVVSKTKSEHEWEKTIFLKDDFISEIKKLKQQEGPDIQVHGSSMLNQALGENDLVDEYWLKFFPVTLGSGKKLFQNRNIPASFKLTEPTITPSGVFVGTFIKNGNVKQGTF